MIPNKDKKAILYKKIKDLRKLGWSMDEIVELLSVSKSTVFFAISGRAKRKLKIKKK